MLRSFRLVRIAASAEGLRLRSQIRRVATQAVLGVIAAVFLLLALAVGHYAGIMALEMRFTPLISALIVLGVDVVLAIIFGVLATRSSPGVVERDAKMVRDQARQQLAMVAATAGLAAPVARMLGARHVSGLVVGALLDRVLARGGRRTPPAR